MRVFLLVALFFLAGCYHTPPEGELRTVPTTNNPHLIQDSTKNSKESTLGKLAGMGI